MEHLHYCTRCGAVLAGGPDFEASGALHAAWHGLLERRLWQIADEAARYKSPPTYGGR